jgi:hypothetical protein
MRLRCFAANGGSGKVGARRGFFATILQDTFERPVEWE